VSSAYRSFAHRVDIGVPVERVWRAFTDSRVLSRWTAADATVTPREKGRLHVIFGSDMEFDGVIVVDPDRIMQESPRGANDLYVALTRATQRLGVLHPGTLPDALLAVVGI